MLKRCPNCGKKYLVDLSICPFCQAPNVDKGEIQQAATSTYREIEQTTDRHLVQQKDFSDLRNDLRACIETILIASGLGALAGILIAVNAWIIALVLAVLAAAVSIFGLIRIYLKLS